MKIGVGLKSICGILTFALFPDDVFQAGGVSCMARPGDFFRERAIFPSFYFVIFPEVPYYSVIRQIRPGASSVVMGGKRHEKSHGTWYA